MSDHPTCGDPRPSHTPTIEFTRDSNAIERDQEKPHYIKKIFQLLALIVLHLKRVLVNMRRAIATELIVCCQSG